MAWLRQEPMQGRLPLLGLRHRSTEPARRASSGLLLGAARAFAQEDRRGGSPLQGDAGHRRRGEMNINVLIAPDFAPEHFAGWHLFNTLMQRKTGLALRLLTSASASEQAQLITDGKADIIYANPFDAASMVRDAGYVALVRPINKANEM